MRFFLALFFTVATLGNIISVNNNCCNLVKTKCENSFSTHQDWPETSCESNHCTQHCLHQSVAFPDEVNWFMPKIVSRNEFSYKEIQSQNYPSKPYRPPVVI